MENFETAFQTFFEGVKTYQQKYHESFGNHEVNLREFTYKEGKRYIKVTYTYKNSQGNSVYCFVDKKTGDVLKAASWNQPAKGARGNIFNADRGLKALRPHGVVTFR
jgi:hypothetical protein